MNFLTLENATKTYGEKVLFRNISLHIDKGQKIGLIAKNGTGKSTLLRVIAGLESSEGENARLILRKDIRIGWLEQEPTLPANVDVLTAVLDPANPIVRIIQRYESAMAHPENPEQLQEAINQMDLHHAWSFEARVKEMLYRFRLEDFTQKVGSLSGGQQKRLALAKILLQDPDLLILDEPTNHLDVEMIEWLEEYLQQPAVTVFMVTHDRYFLENVCDTILELEGGQLYRYSGSYADYLEKKARREEIEATTYERQSKLLKRELEWVRRSPAARTTKAKARIDAYYERVEALESLRKKPEEIVLAIKENWLGSKVVELHNVSKSFGNKKVLENFTYKFKRRERVGIVGPNGSGKSTFLDILTGALPPDTGKVVIGDTIVFGHYRQEGIRLPEDKRVIEVIRDIAEYIPLEKGKTLSAAQLLELFLFPRPQQQVYVSQLSGGERRRLYLLTILMKNPNFLILDEPTNDLDVPTLQVLENFLEDYPGCLVVVTHDRYFMDRLVEHLFIFEGDGKIKDFNGTYAEYRALKRTEAAAPRTAEIFKNTVFTPSGLSSAERNEMKRLEKDIAALERRKQEILECFNNTNLNPAEINRLSEELSDVHKKLEEKEFRWLELAERAG
ncbi:MAG: ABC-F family ATP-binding cassette domain-containing protein [Saprospiraceae bacterium]|nr:ABC-F family ATP-binding cassette domain-containing protein [Saprospiraceae bacterium]MDW8483597.1 ABC-F family ATP-binding cassette domain-containing protein [Saprospiraceae bacterium]